MWLPFSTKLISNAERIWVSGNCTIVVGANCSSAIVGAPAMVTNAPAMQAVANFKYVGCRTLFSMMGYSPRMSSYTHGSMSRSTHGSKRQHESFTAALLVAINCLQGCQKQQVLLASN